MLSCKIYYSFPLGKQANKYIFLGSVSTADPDLEKVRLEQVETLFQDFPFPFNYGEEKILIV